MSPPSNDAHRSPPRNDDERQDAQRHEQRSGPSEQRDRRTRTGEQRPHPPSSFDLEPNPFEQSFSCDPPDAKPPANNKSPTPPHKHPVAPTATTPKPVLPSLAALSSPSDGYTWSDLAGSLRSGPLSPAMLQGPAAQQPSHTQNSISLPFDPARPFARTGLTPSTGLTPLVGGPVSFPPPSPNTAAFLAMVTNASSASQIAPSPATITPNTLNAITGMMNPAQPPPQQQPPQQQTQAQTTILPAASTSAATASSIAAVAPQHHLPMQGYPYGQQNGFQPSSTAATASAANGLFLLSQAHQELTKREEAQARAGAGVPDGVMQGRRGAKRKSIDGPLPTRGATNKRPRAAPRGRRAKASASAEEDEDSMEEDEMHAEEEGEHIKQNGTTKKPETEEEKRRNFLERNRQGKPQTPALKCRQRKKAWLAKLQAENEFLKQENERLTSALVSSRDEISRLNALLGAHAGGGVGGAAGIGMGGVGGVGQGQPVSVSVSLPPAGKTMTAHIDSPSTGGGPAGVGGAPPVSVVNGRGYGY